MPALTKEDSSLATDSYEISKMLGSTFQTIPVISTERNLVISTERNSNITKRKYTHRLPQIQTNHDSSTISALDMPLRTVELKYFLTKCSNTSHRLDGIANILLFNLPLITCFPYSTVSGFTMYSQTGGRKP